MPRAMSVYNETRRALDSSALGQCTGLTYEPLAIEIRVPHGTHICSSQVSSVSTVLDRPYCIETGKRVKAIH